MYPHCVLRVSTKRLEKHPVCIYHFKFNTRAGEFEVSGKPKGHMVGKIHFLAVMCETHFALQSAREL